jgi:hypothetical protein
MFNPTVAAAVGRMKSLGPKPRKADMSLTRNLATSGKGGAPKRRAEPAAASISRASDDSNNEEENATQEKRARLASVLPSDAMKFISWLQTRQDSTRSLVNLPAELQPHARGFLDDEASIVYGNRVAASLLRETRSGAAALTTGDRLVDSKQLASLRGWTVKRVHLTSIEHQHLIPPTCTELVLDDRLDKPGLVIPESVRHFVMGDRFNQYGLKLPLQLEELTMGGHYNQPDLRLPESLRYFRMGRAYDQPGLLLPDQLLDLRFGDGYQQTDWNMPSQLVRFVIGSYYDKTIKPFPPSLRMLVVGRNQRRDNFHIPDGVEWLEFDYFHAMIGYVIPNSVKTLVMKSQWNPSMQDIPESVTTLRLQSVLEGHGVPETVKHLSVTEIDNFRDHPLHEGLLSLDLSEYNGYGKPTLPKSLKSLTVGPNQDFSAAGFPPNLQTLRFTGHYTKFHLGRHRFPFSLTRLYLGTQEDTSGLILPCANGFDETDEDKLRKSLMPERIPDVYLQPRTSGKGGTPKRKVEPAAASISRASDMNDEDDVEEEEEDEPLREKRARLASVLPSGAMEFMSWMQTRQDPTHSLINLPAELQLHVTGFLHKAEHNQLGVVRGWKSHRFLLKSVAQQHLIPPTCTELVMSDECNESGLVIPDGIADFTMGDNYNQSDFRLPNSVKRFKMGNAFNQPGLILPSRLEEFSGGYYYNQRDMILPDFLRIFGMSVRYNQPGLILPAGLLDFTMGFSYDQTDLIMPPHLIRFVMGPRFNPPACELPQSLRILSMGSTFLQPGFRIPNGVEWLQLNNARFADELSIPLSVTTLDAYYSYTWTRVNISSSVTTLRMHRFPTGFRLPATVQHLSVGDIQSSKDHPLHEGLLTLDMSRYYGEDMPKLPDSLESLYTGPHQMLAGVQLPPKLKTLKMSKASSNAVLLHYLCLPASVTRLHVYGRAGSVRFDRQIVNGFEETDEDRAHKGIMPERIPDVYLHPRTSGKVPKKISYTFPENHAPPRARNDAWSEAFKQQSPAMIKGTVHQALKQADPQSVIESGILLMGADIRLGMIPIAMTEVDLHDVNMHRQVRMLFRLAKKLASSLFTRFEMLRRRPAHSIRTEDDEVALYSDLGPLEQARIGLGGSHTSAEHERHHVLLQLRCFATILCLYAPDFFDQMTEGSPSFLASPQWSSPATLVDYLPSRLLLLYYTVITDAQPSSAVWIPNLHTVFPLWWKCLEPTNEDKTVTAEEATNRCIFALSYYSYPTLVALHKALQADPNRLDVDAGKGFQLSLGQALYQRLHRDRVLRLPRQLQVFETKAEGVLTTYLGWDAPNASMQQAQAGALKSADQALFIHNLFEMPDVLHTSRVQSKSESQAFDSLASDEEIVSLTPCQYYLAAYMCIWYPSYFKELCGSEDDIWHDRPLVPSRLLLWTMQHDPMHNQQSASFPLSSTSVTSGKGGAPKRVHAAASSRSNRVQAGEEDNDDDDDDEEEEAHVSKKNKTKPSAAHVKPVSRMSEFVAGIDAASDAAEQVRLKIRNMSVEEGRYVSVRAAGMKTDEEADAFTRERQEADSKDPGMVNDQLRKAQEAHLANRTLAGRLPDELHELGYHDVGNVWYEYIANRGQATWNPDKSVYDAAAEAHAFVADTNEAADTPFHQFQKHVRACYPVLAKYELITAGVMNESDNESDEEEKYEGAAKSSEHFRRIVNAYESDDEDYFASRREDEDEEEDGNAGGDASSASVGNDSFAHSLKAANESRRNECKSQANNLIASVLDKVKGEDIREMHEQNQHDDREALEAYKSWLNLGAYRGWQPDGLVPSLYKPFIDAGVADHAQKALELQPLVQHLLPLPGSSKERNAHLFSRRHKYVDFERASDFRYSSVFDFPCTYRKAFLFCAYVAVWYPAVFTSLLDEFGLRTPHSINRLPIRAEVRNPDDYKVPGPFLFVPSRLLILLVSDDGYELRVNRRMKRYIIHEVQEDWSRFVRLFSEINPDFSFFPEVFLALRARKRLLGESFHENAKTRMKTRTLLVHPARYRELVAERTRFFFGRYSNLELIKTLRKNIVPFVYLTPHGRSIGAYGTSEERLAEFERIAESDKVESAFFQPPAESREQMYEADYAIYEELDMRHAELFTHHSRNLIGKPRSIQETRRGVLLKTIRKRREAMLPMIAAKVDEVTRSAASMSTEDKEMEYAFRGWEAMLPMTEAEVDTATNDAVSLSRLDEEMEHASREWEQYCKDRDDILRKAEAAKASAAAPVHTLIPRRKHTAAATAAKSSATSGKRVMAPKPGTDATIDLRPSLNWPYIRQAWDILSPVCDPVPGPMAFSWREAFMRTARAQWKPLLLSLDPEQLVQLQRFLNVHPCAEPNSKYHFMRELEGVIAARHSAHFDAPSTSGKDNKRKAVPRRNYAAAAAAAASAQADDVEEEEEDGGEDEDLKKRARIDLQSKIDVVPNFLRAKHSDWMLRCIAKYPRLRAPLKPDDEMTDRDIATQALEYIYHGMYHGWTDDLGKNMEILAEAILPVQHFFKLYVAVYYPSRIEAWRSNGSFHEDPECAGFETGVSVLCTLFGLPQRDGGSASDRAPIPQSAWAALLIMDDAEKVTPDSSEAKSNRCWILWKYLQSMIGYEEMQQIRHVVGKLPNRNSLQKDLFNQLVRRISHMDMQSMLVARLTQGIHTPNTNNRFRLHRDAAHALHEMLAPKDVVQRLAPWNQGRATASAASAAAASAPATSGKNGAGSASAAAAASSSLSDTFTDRLREMERDDVPQLVLQYMTNKHSERQASSDLQTTIELAEAYANEGFLYYADRANPPRIQYKDEYETQYLILYELFYAYFILYAPVRYQELQEREVHNMSYMWLLVVAKMPLSVRAFASYSGSPPPYIQAAERVLMRAFLRRSYATRNEIQSTDWIDEYLSGWSFVLSILSPAELRSAQQYFEQCNLPPFAYVFLDRLDDALSSRGLLLPLSSDTP